ncbi:MAG: response regulator [Campylobacterota bacterium]|nr:response regulator [Campylobacterota bacterium]
MTLLLTDDDQLLRSQIRFSIESMFDEVFEASNIQESFDIIINNDVDIALVDLALENEFDGIEISKKTVEQSIKTIVFTANKSDDVVKQLIKEGVFDYLNKPVSIPTLIDSLNRAILFKENEQKLEKENIYKLDQCVDAKDGIKNSLTHLEKDLLVKILKQNDFNIYQCAKLLNTKRENIYYFIKKYGISRD